MDFIVGVVLTLALCFGCLLVGASVVCRREAEKRCNKQGGYYFERNFCVIDGKLIKLKED